MQTFEELKRQAQEEYQKQKTRVSSTKTHRSAGVVMLLIGLAFAVGEFLGFQVTGRVFALLLAFPVVLIPAGAYMLVTGKNPFAKLKP